MRHRRCMTAVALGVVTAAVSFSVSAQVAPQPRIAFAVNSPSVDIFTVDLNGRNLLNLTKNAVWGSAPSWSPDGSQLAFASATRAEGRGGIYVMNADGAAVRPLSNEIGSNYGPTWSPGGTRIAFISTRDNWGYAGVFVMDANGANQRIVTGAPLFHDVDPAWSPDGGRIAFKSSRDGNGELYVIDEDGANLRRLTDDPAEDGGPTWSPDGRTIAFHSDRGGASDIYTMDLDGRRVRRLTEAAGPWATHDPHGRRTGSSSRFSPLVTGRGPRRCT